MSARVVAIAWCLGAAGSVAAFAAEPMALTAPSSVSCKPAAPRAGGAPRPAPSPIEVTVTCAQPPAADKPQAPVEPKPPPETTPPPPKPGGETKSPPPDVKSGSPAQKTTTTDTDKDKRSERTWVDALAAFWVLALASACLYYAGKLLKAALMRSNGDGDFTFRRHWGGFGGGSEGWHLSTPLVMVLAALVLASLAAFLALQVVRRNQPDAPPAAPAREAKAASAAAPEK